MAENTGERERKRRRSENGGPPRKKRRRPSAGRAAAAARREISELMDREPEAVSGVERDGDGGGWLVTVEFVELERVPQSTDVMATYEVELNSDGELEGYRRTRRYVRSQAEG